MADPVGQFLDHSFEGPHRIQRSGPDRANLTRLARVAPPNRLDNLVDADFEVVDEDKKKKLIRISKFPPLLAVQSFAASALLQVKPSIQSKKRIQNIWQSM